MKSFKKILITLLYLIAGIQTSFSQWIEQPIPIGVGIFLSIDFIDDNTGISGGYIFGLTGNPSGKAVYTTNAGANWNLAIVPDSSHSFGSVKFINAQTGYMAGAYNTQNSNHTGVKNSTFSFSRSDFLKGLKPPEIFGISGFPDYKAFFVKTTNSGISWFTYGTLPQQYNYLIGMDFINENTGFVTAGIQDTTLIVRRGNILKTTNGGLSWSEQLSSYIIGDLKTIKSIDPNSVIAVGTDIDIHSGIILKSVNGGFNWTTQIINDVELSDVFFTNSSTGFVTGSSQLIAQQFVYKTTNQGLNWNIVKILNSSLISGIKFFPGSGTGMIYGSYEPPPPAVLSVTFTSRTTNFGDSWGGMQYLDTGNFVLSGGILLSPYNMYITGGNVFNEAVIYHTTNGGSTSVNNIGTSSPDKFYLSQNYPNPFNPVTKISYGVPDQGKVLLKIFDIKGKEVSTLVNEVQNAGYYSVSFNSHGLSSGVYFYSLASGDFEATKRMLLVK